jgi:hypothetical protein
VLLLSIVAMPRKAKKIIENPNLEVSKLPLLAYFVEKLD